MALPNDRDHIARNARKHFIQPALPALSLISKTESPGKIADRQESNTSNNESNQSSVDVSDLSKEEIDHIINVKPTNPQESLSTDSESQSFQDSTASELPLSSATDSDKSITVAALKAEDTLVKEPEVLEKTTSETDITSMNGKVVENADDQASSSQGSDSVVLSETDNICQPHKDQNETQVLLSSSPSQSNSTSPVQSTQETHSETSSDTATIDTQSDSDMRLSLVEVNTPDPFAINMPWPDGLLTLNQHLNKVFETKECSDWVISVAPRGAMPFVTYAYSLFLRRSTLLRGLMTQSANTSSGVINIQPPRPIHPHGFETALKFLYTDKLLNASFNPAGNPASRVHPEREEFIELTFSYWASGIELGLGPVVIQAETLLRDTINWDIVEMVASEAQLLMSMVRNAPIENGLLPGYTSMASLVMKTATTFLANNIKTNGFRLDVMGGARFMTPRLGPMNYGRSVANPALANLTFGSMPAHAVLNTLVPVPPTNLVYTSPENTITSNILLNMDFHGLRLLAKEYIAVQGPAAISVMQLVVNERENQRLNVIANRYTMGGPRQTDPEIWELVGLKEILEGDTLRRERVGRHY